MAKIETTTLIPSDTYATLHVAAVANIPLFLWGPPGVGKSAIAQMLATTMGVAFVDIRLSQMDPTDVRGMPFKVEEEGVTVGVDWSPPLMFPKDINKTMFKAIEAIETPVEFSNLNPVGSNGIHYVKSPQVEVRSLDKSLTPIVSDETPTSFIVKLVTNEDAKTLEGLSGDERAAALYDLEAHAGRVRYTITGEAEAIIGYEEMNSAPPSVLAACYQLILDRRIGNYVLPRKVAQFAMGNRETDKGVTFKMPTPLVNRFDHIELRPHFDDWQAWATTSMVHSDVVGFLSAFPNSMFNFNPGTAARGFATPRSWVMVSNLLKTVDKGEVAISDGQLQAMIYGAVGDGIGAEFFEFRKIAQALPQPKDVLSGRVTRLDRGKIKDDDMTGLSYALTTSLLYVLKERDTELNAEGHNEGSKGKERNEWYGWVDNYISFALDNFKAEVNVMGIRSALQSHGLPINGMRCAQWSSFVKKYKNVMIDG